MNEAMVKDMIGGFVSCFGFSFLVLSPLIVYRVFFKKQVEHDKELSGGTGRNISFTPQDEKGMLSVLTKYGFGDCDEDDAFVKRWNEAHASENLYTRFIRSRKNTEGEQSYIGLRYSQLKHNKKYR